MKLNLRQVAIKTTTASLIAASALLLTGCGTKTTTTPTVKIDTSQKVNLTIWRTFDDDTTFTQAIQDYQSNHSNVKITYVKKDITDYEVQSINALAAGTGPDIWSIRDDWMPRHSDKLIPMPDNFIKSTVNKETRSNTDYYKAVWAPVAATENIINGKVYGIPLYMDTLALYINTTLWQDAQRAYRNANANNPNFSDALFRKYPSTWNDLLDELPYLVKKDAKGNILQAGIALGTSNNVPAAADILSLLMMQNGTKMTDDTQKSARFNVFQNDSSGAPVYNGTKALDFYTSFAKSNKANYTWNTAQTDALQSFIDGKTAIFVGYQFNTATLKQRAPTLQYDVSQVPQVQGAAKVNYASYWTETVTNNSRHADVAWDFIRTLAARPNSYLQATKRPSALNQDPSIDLSYDPFLAQVPTAANWNKGKYSDSVNGTLNSLIDNVINNNMPLQQAMDTAGTAVTALLQKE